MAQLSHACFPGTRKEKMSALPNVKLEKFCSCTSLSHVSNHAMMTRATLIFLQASNNVGAFVFPGQSTILLSYHVCRKKRGTAEEAPLHTCHKTSFWGPKKPHTIQKSFHLYPVHSPITLGQLSIFCPIFEFDENTNLNLRAKNIHWFEPFHSKWRVMDKKGVLPLVWQCVN